MCMSGSGKRSQVTQAQHDLETDATAIEIVVNTDKLVNKVRKNLGMHMEYERDDNGEPIPGTGEYVVDDAAPMNKTGIKNVTAFLREQVDQNQVLSNYELEQINRLVKDIHMSLARDLSMNWVRYGINNRASYDRVMAAVTNNCYSAYLRALDGETLKQLMKSTKTITESNKTVEADGDSRNIPRGPFG